MTTRTSFGIAAGLCAVTALCVTGPPLRAADEKEPVLLFTSNREGRPKLYQVNPMTGATQALHQPQGSESLAVWSPDGSRIAFCSSRSGNHDIWVMEADGSNVRQLTTDPKPDYVSAWSPDGKRIAFTSERTGDLEIFVMNADGGEQTNLTNNPETDGDPAWSPDGKSILFASRRDGQGYRLYMMDPDGSNIRLFPGKPGSGGPVFPAWSPDGKRVAYSEDVGGIVEVFTCDADGGNLKQLTKLGGINTFPAWSPDGNQIALEHWDSKEANGVIWVVTVADGVQSQLGDGGSYLSGRPAWKPVR